MGASCTTALKWHEENRRAFGLVEIDHSKCVVPFYEETELMSVRKVVYFSLEVILNCSLAFHFVIMQMATINVLFEM